MIVQVTMKSGAQLQFTAQEITKTKNVATGQLTGVEWTNGDGPELFYIRVDEIAAIVTADTSDVGKAAR